MVDPDELALFPTAEGSLRLARAMRAAISAKSARSRKERCQREADRSNGEPRTARPLSCSPSLIIRVSPAGFPILVNPNRYRTLISAGLGLGLGLSVRLPLTKRVNTAKCKCCYLLRVSTLLVILISAARQMAAWSDCASGRLRICAQWRQQYSHDRGNNSDSDSGS